MCIFFLFRICFKKEEQEKTTRENFNSNPQQAKLMSGTSVKEPFGKFIKNNIKNRSLIITCGLPGSWKSKIAWKISTIKSYPILKSDMIRLEVLNKEDIFDSKIAGNMDKRLAVYKEVFRRADELAKKENGIILDATFVTQDLRRQAAEIAARNNMSFVIIQTKCPEEVSIALINRRTKEKYESNALTVDAYYVNKKNFEAIDIDELKKLNSEMEILYEVVEPWHDDKEEWFVTFVDKR